jgi:hypothetical protein
MSATHFNPRASDCALRPQTVPSLQQASMRALCPSRTCSRAACPGSLTHLTLCSTGARMVACWTFTRTWQRSRTTMLPTGRSCLMGVSAQHPGPMGRACGARRSGCCRCVCVLWTHHTSVSRVEWSMGYPCTCQSFIARSYINTLVAQLMLFNRQGLS